MKKITTVLDRDRSPNLLTPALERLYGSALGFPRATPHRPYVVINFVKTLDGIISFKLPDQEYAQFISNHSREDAFIMGLLRALSDAVLEGTTNIVGFPKHTLLPERVDSHHAKFFAGLRRQWQKPAHPIHVFLTRTGIVTSKRAVKQITQIPLVFRTPEIRSVIITTTSGAARAKRAFRGYESCLPEIFAAGNQEINLPTAMRYLRQTHHIQLLVIEGGPNLTGSVVQAGQYDEWFLTTAPQIAGTTPASQRPTLVQGAAFTPQTAPWHHLVSLKISGDYVFERYRTFPPREVSGSKAQNTAAASESFTYNPFPSGLSPRLAKGSSGTSRQIP